MIFLKSLIVIFLVSFTVNADAKPAIAVVVADWGMNEALHNALEPNIPSTFTFALHFMGKKTVATGPRALLVQVPTISELQHAVTYSNKCSSDAQKRMQGVWVELHDGQSSYPSKAVLGAYTVFSQPPLNPLPAPRVPDALVGQFWVDSSMPTSERQKIYNMALGYATKSKEQACILSVSFSTQEAWDDFQKWYKANESTVRWITIQEYAATHKNKQAYHG